MRYQDYDVLQHMKFHVSDGFLPLEMGRWWHCYFMWVMDSKCIIVSMCLECWPIS